MRTLIHHDPYGHLRSGEPFWRRGRWPCHWIVCPDLGAPPFVTAYRKRFAVDRDVTLRAHVTADERYELFLDGRRIGRGSERGDKDNWFYETYDLPLAAGSHVLVARVWSLGPDAPRAQMSVHPGFLFSPEGEFIELLGTGVTEWEAKKLAGYGFIDPAPAWGTGANLMIDAAEFPWGFEQGAGEGWLPAIKLQSGLEASIYTEYPDRGAHLLKPATLPPMLETDLQTGIVRSVEDIGDVDFRRAVVSEEKSDPVALQAWHALLHHHQAVTIPAQTQRRVIIDLQDYYCAYPELVATGGRGSSIWVVWAEALYHAIGPDALEMDFPAHLETQAARPLFQGLRAEDKGHRDEIEGKFFLGVGDLFRPDGGVQRRFETLWWQAGRYIEIIIQTANESVTVEAFKLRETRYPLEMESAFAASDPRVLRVIPIAWRGLQMCAHETYIDCPYYEQLMYIGDTRLEALATYVLTRDDRLPRKALRMFDASRLPSGLTQSRYPSNGIQIIPGFSLWWIGMVYDYALWRDDPAFVHSLMPGVRAVLDGMCAFFNADGFIQAPFGWNYLDWVPQWMNGIPPEGDAGVSSLINWQMVLAWKMAAELEAACGEPELAARARRLAAELAARLIRLCWNESRGLLADDLAQEYFSEHAQCLALLSGQLDPGRIDRISQSLLHEEKLARATIYFTHYLFEAYHLLGHTEALFDRLRLWFDLEKLGFKTPYELPEPTRSDCHGWGAHPLYHYFATILGIRPAALGFRRAIIAPQLGSLTSAKGILVHPKGEIQVDFRVIDGSLKGRVILPPSVEGTLSYHGQEQPLYAGEQEIVLGKDD